MLEALKSVFKDNWNWREQIVRLAVFELRRRTSNTVFSWAWLFVKPLAYVFCFWFALRIGLRTGATTVGGTEVPYILWLCAGVIPFFFMRDIITAGSNLFKRYGYLVNKIKFPLLCIPSIFAVGTMIVQLILEVGLIALYFNRGMQLDIHLLQIPILLLLTYVFWYFCSITFSILSAFSKDFSNLLGIMNIPIFWLSGVIFNLANVSNSAIHTVLLFNPVTFLITGFRDALCYHTWFWEDPVALVAFIGVFALTVVVAMALYSRFSQELADVL